MCRHRLSGRRRKKLIAITSLLYYHPLTPFFHFVSVSLIDDKNESAFCSSQCSRCNESRVRTTSPDFDSFQRNFSNCFCCFYCVCFRFYSSSQSLTFLLILPSRELLLLFVRLFLRLVVNLTRRCSSLRTTFPSLTTFLHQLISNVLRAFILAFFTSTDSRRGNFCFFTFLLVFFLFLPLFHVRSAFGSNAARKRAGR